MDASLAETKQSVESQIEVATIQLRSLRHQASIKGEELDRLLDSGRRYQILGDICESLDKLEELGATSLFWGENKPQHECDQQLKDARKIILHFQQQVEETERNKNEIDEQAQEKIEFITDLNYQLEEILEEEELRKSDYIVERDVKEITYRPLLMPWATRKEDQRRYYKSLGSVLLLLVCLNLLLIFWELPDLSQEPVEVPEYLVEMVKKTKPKPQPPVEKPKPKEEKEEEKKMAENEKKPKPTPKPTPEQKNAARKKAEASGVLAFKDSFEDLLEDDVDQKLGAAANIRNNASSARGDSSRTLVMSQARQTSGGINNATISRGIGGNAGEQLGTGISFSRVDSAIGTDMVADDRPLSDGVGPTRTDEEIQIVFDRYKAALYRIYNRELRKNPLLKGKMVLRIIIEPDGSVSLVKLESSNMDAPGLASGVVNRVTRFNFGPKEGVPQITILYPIDFLPAA